MGIGYQKKIKIEINYQNNLSPEEINLDTLVYEKNGFRFYYSDAVLNSISDIGGIYSAFRIFKIFPKTIRDYVYKIISKLRNRF